MDETSPAALQISFTEFRQNQDRPVARKVRFLKARADHSAIVLAGNVSSLRTDFTPGSRRASFSATRAAA